MALSVSIVILIFLVTSTLILGLVCVIAGAAGGSWWELTTDLTLGLWKTCADSDCTNRENILKFDNEKRNDSKDLDATLLALILSAIFGIVALVPTFLMIFICRVKPKSLNTVAVLATLFTFIAATAALGAVIYAEVQFDEPFDTHDRGWANVIAWVGAVSLFIAFAFGLSLVCCTAYNKQETVKSSYDTRPGQSGMAGRSVNGQANKGYEMQ